MRICDYGCGREAKYLITLKSGIEKWCCEESFKSCPEVRRKVSNSRKGMKFSVKTRKKMSIAKIGKKSSEETKNKLRKSVKEAMNRPDIKEKTLLKRSISTYKKKYPLFAKVEQMRYNPNKPGEKEIQVHCKNHNCPNSKEQGGWFTPTYIQLYERIRQLEHPEGNQAAYFYCSEECKEECPLFNKRVSQLIKDDKIKAGIIPKEYYTNEELKVCREEVFKRDNNECLYCGGKSEHMHHIRPQKLEPFFSLDPDYCISVCLECHYKYGHKDECSTGQLAQKVCT